MISDVCGHLGLQPQLVVDSSGYKVQGRDEDSAKKILDNAKILDSLGVSILVLECVPSHLAKLITNSAKNTNNWNWGWQRIAMARFWLVMIC